MGLDQLRRALERAGVNADVYAIGEGTTEGRYTIKREFADVWVTYHDRNGAMESLRTFKTEGAACREFISWIFQRASARQSRIADREELRAAFEFVGIDPHVYSLSGPSMGDQYLIRQEPDGSWAIYYYERGGRNDLRTFATESEACQHFFERVVRSCIG